MSQRGATQSGTSFRQRFQSYREHHKEVALESLKRLIATPLPTAMTLMVIAIAICLPAGLYVMLMNAEKVSQDWNGSAQISLYLKHSITAQDGRDLAVQLESNSDVERTEYISRDQALAEFQQQSGLGDILNELGENPLPAVIVVYPKAGDLHIAETLQATLSKQNGVDLAQLDAEWVQRLYAFLELGRRLVAALSLALSLAVLLVIVNTIRLSIESRRDEIVIIKLVGATDAFVQRPFMYTGLWYGLGGSLMALILIHSLLWWLERPVEVLTELYRSPFELSGLGFEVTFLVLFGSILVGLIGAKLAVAQHIRSIEPK